MHIPFKGGPEALAEVMNGRIDFVFSPILPSLPFIREGKAIALGVDTAKRASALPDVPTTIEAGFANSDYNFWIGMFVPARTPRDIVDKLHQETVKVRQSPEFQAKLANFGADPMLDAPRRVRRLYQKRDRRQRGARQSGRARSKAKIKEETHETTKSQVSSVRRRGRHVRNRLGASRG